MNEAFEKFIRSRPYPNHDEVLRKWKDGTYVYLQSDYVSFLAGQRQGLQGAAKWKRMAAKWKRMAEIYYGKVRYPNEPDLANGALDALFNASCSDSRCCYFGKEKASSCACTKDAAIDAAIAQGK